MDRKLGPTNCPPPLILTRRTVASVTVAYTAAWIFSQRILIHLNGTFNIRSLLKGEVNGTFWLDSATARRAAATFPTKTVTVAVGSTSVEGLSQEVSTRLRSAQHQTGLVSRSYCQRLQGTLQSSSGGFLDSYITIEINTQDSSTEGTPSEGSVRPAENEDSLDKKPDCETGEVPYKPSEGPLMTTRRF